MCDCLKFCFKTCLDKTFWSIWNEYHLLLVINKIIRIIKSLRTCHYAELKHWNVHYVGDNRNICFHMHLTLYQQNAISKQQNYKYICLHTVKTHAMEQWTGSEPSRFRSFVTSCYYITTLLPCIQIPIDEAKWAM